MSARCHVAHALWSEQPPDHAVCCLTVLTWPPSIWTGGREGHVVRWRIDTEAFDTWQSSEVVERGERNGRENESEEKILTCSRKVWPASLLHGHSFPITFLSPCTSGSLSTPLFFPSSSQTRLSPLPTNLSQGVSENGVDRKQGAVSEVNGIDSVLSSCSEGVLCVWDSLTGRCRIRQKLPSWAGTPVSGTGLSHDSRYVCIGCNGVSPEEREEDKEGREEKEGEVGRGSVEKERGVRGSCVIIVDVKSLTIVQTIGRRERPVDDILGNNLRVVRIPEKDGEGKAPFKVMAASKMGEIYQWEGILNTSVVDNIDELESGTFVKREGAVGKDVLDIMEWERGSYSEQTVTATKGLGIVERKILIEPGNFQAVKLSPDGLLVLYVLSHVWFLKIVESGKTVHKELCSEEEMSRIVDKEGPLWSSSKTEEKGQGNKINSHSANLLRLLVGGIFLENLSLLDKREGSQISDGRGDFPAYRFLIWDDIGAAKIYSFSFSLSKTGSEIAVLAVFPRVQSGSLSSVSLFSYHFSQIGNTLVRTGGGSPTLGNGFGNNNNNVEVEIWRLPDQEFSRTGDRFQENEKNEFGPFEAVLCERTCMREDRRSESERDKRSDRQKGYKYARQSEEDDEGEEDKVTSSCLIGGGLLAPAVLVRGYASGLITVLALTADSWQDYSSSEDSLNSGKKVDMSSDPLPMQRLRGHIGPVLCLLQHGGLSGKGEMSSSPRRNFFSSGSSVRQPFRVLLSGGMDWTVRIWDLGGEGVDGDFLLGGISLLAVLHPHTSPVCQIKLPPVGTSPPWAFCFLSISKDGVVALSSLETLSCERIFGGHQSVPKGVIWDSHQSYLGCLCSWSTEGSLRKKKLGENKESKEGREALDRDVETANGIQASPSKELEEEEDVRLKKKVASGNTTEDVLFVWDLQSGARERVLKGPQAISLYTHLVSRVESTGGMSISTYEDFKLDPLNESNAQKFGKPRVPEKNQENGNNYSREGKGLLRSSSFGPSLNHSFSGALSTLALSLTDNSNTSKAVSPDPPPPPPPQKQVEELYPDLTKGTLLQNQQKLERMALKGGCPVPGMAIVKLDLRLLLALSSTRTGEETGDVTNRTKDKRVEDTISNSVGETGASGKAGLSKTTVIGEGFGVKKSPQDGIREGGRGEFSKSNVDMELWMLGMEGRSMRLALSFLHIWGIDDSLDEKLRSDLRVSIPQNLWIGGAIIGDKGALTLGFPNFESRLDMWQSSPVFSALHSLGALSLANRLSLLSSSARQTCLRLSDHYTKAFQEGLSCSRVREGGTIIKPFCPPSLEILSFFWQDPDPHIRSVARSLFHSAALQSFPPILGYKPFINSTNDPSLLSLPNTPMSSKSSSFTRLPSPSSQPQTPFDPIKDSPKDPVKSHNFPVSASGKPPSYPPPPPPPRRLSLAIDVPPQPDWGGWEPSEVADWLDSLLSQDWIQWIGGSPQDAKNAKIVMGAALAIWYPSKGRPDLSPSLAPPLLRLVRSANSYHSAAGGELLAEGMQSTWQPLIGPHIPRLIADVFLLCESLEGGGGGDVRGEGDGSGGGVSAGYYVIPKYGERERRRAVRESLANALLPALAIANMPAFLSALQAQFLTLPPDSPVHQIGLNALLTAIRGNPRAVISHLNQVAVFLMQAMDPAVPSLRKKCLQRAMGIALELPQIFATASLHHGSGTNVHAKLAIGEALVDSAQVAVHVYDLVSATKVRILDASGPPGHPGLMGLHHRGGNIAKLSTLGSLGGISAIAFSPDGEGLVAFAQRGLVLRWWSLGSQWWEKLSRGPTLMQCSKMVLVPPLPGISSFPSLVGGPSEHSPTGESGKPRGQTPMGAALVTLDLGFRLEWTPKNQVVLYHNGVEIAIF